MTYTPIEQLDLSVRAYNCLKRAGVDFVEEIKDMSEDELNNIRNLGRNGLRDIQEKLAEFKNKDSLKLFRVAGLDYDNDSFSYLMVSESKEGLESKLQELEDRNEITDRHYGYYITEVKEVDGYRIRLERIGD